MYVGDAGYLENSGLHTLLALWADIRDWVEKVNTSRAKNVRVVPIAVLVDNHFRSGAARIRRPTLNELSAPLKASQKPLISQGALE